MSYQPSERLQWLNLPQEVQDLVLNFVFANRTFLYSAKGTAPAFNVCRVSKKFATQEAAVNAILRSGTLRIDDVPGLEGIVTLLSPEQKHSMKTVTISQALLEGIGYKLNTLQHVTAALGNFRLDVTDALQVYISVSKHSSIARRIKRKPEDSLKYIDWEDDIRNGFVSKVEMETMLLDACVDHRTQYTGIGPLLNCVASYDIEMNVKVCVTFIERQTITILAVCEAAGLSTKHWHVKVPMPDGQQLSIDQGLSKDCFVRGLKDVRSLLSHMTPKRWAAMMTLGSGSMEQYKWLWFYQTSAEAMNLARN